MTRCFVAVLPDEAVNCAVDRAVAAAVGPGSPWRPVAPERRHVTLRFHADADAGELADTLRPRVAGLPAPTLRLEGAGIFGTVLWLGVLPVLPDDARRWSGLLAAVGEDPAGHVAHLTVCRARERPGAVPAGLEGRHGPSWTPGEVVLVASGVPHRVLERFPLVGGGEAVGPGR
ncbi:2'-5' RNA ligase family protein [Actinomycetospora atypica]|uniref:2'-5' RNA ligase family protein n=1 Tax=Actinomycetospora atypica TaxID=1290095 RepID=A0ABV9YW58_9PSEU